MSFRIEHGEVLDLSHPGPVLSFKLVDEWSADVIAKLCHFIHYFTDQDSAGVWIDRHPDKFVLSLPDAIELGRIWGQQVFRDLHPHAVTQLVWHGRPPCRPNSDRTDDAAGPACLQ